MLSKTLQDAINEQIKHEIDSAYLYLSMSAYCESANLHGTAQWLRVQWQEELGHAMRFYTHVNDRGGRVILQPVDRPPAEFKSILDIFQQVLAHEQKVSGLINRLYELAVKENDHATQFELQWFIKEQVEEEKSAAEILAQIKMLGETGTSLFMLDRQLGARKSG